MNGRAETLRPKAETMEVKDFIFLFENLFAVAVLDIYELEVEKETKQHYIGKTCWRLPRR